MHLQTKISQHLGIDDNDVQWFLGSVVETTLTRPRRRAKGDKQIRGGRLDKGTKADAEVYVIVCLFL